ncbi:DnaJ-domain-containing protein [Ascodesmis nigricans]|uniref:DnaJ-domain-containing protein n=1 Tax=Ascodesmis nigricans TaxID=341454 RepID=A0A4V3SIK2_9PEZI|nr:DnaJ-domain-containing protein [Ascodesmis nigricans]
MSHYETLNIHPTATIAEIKARFYELSKKHHPDANPTDPEAGKRFIKISTAYSVLSRPESRQKYDRELGARQHGHHSPHYAGSARGSRPASGLSRRKTQPKGPPPSYYAHGGGRGGGGYSGRAHAHAAGMGHSGSSNTGASNFSWGAKKRQHEVHEARWAARGPRVKAIVDLPTILKFVLVSGILGLCIFSGAQWKQERSERKSKA